MNKKDSPFGLPRRAIDDFNWESLQEIQAYCNENYVKDADLGDLDVIIGGYQRWLLKNNFQIIDKNG